MSSDSAWHDALAAVGARIAPLKTLDDVAGFFLSCASIVHGVPNRAVNLIRHMGGTFPATLIQGLLDRVQEMPRVRALLDLLPARDGMQLITSRLSFHLRRVRLRSSRLRRQAETILRTHHVGVRCEA